MATVAETASQSPYAAALAAGVDTISLGQSVTFYRYVRVVLPLDGFVFWVRDTMLSASALMNAGVPNTATPNQAQRAEDGQAQYGAEWGGPGSFGGPGVMGGYEAPVYVLAAQGSMHHSTELHQTPDENYSTSSMVFTSLEEINDLHDIAPNVMFIGAFEGKQFAFSRRAPFYNQSGLWHYVGTALTAEMATQVLDTAVGLDTRNVIVSNSMPIWLAIGAPNLANYPQPGAIFGGPGPFGGPGVAGSSNGIFPAIQDLPMYPAYLLPQNLEPPFASVDIPPESTQAIQAAPVIDKQGTRWQLVRERVKITIYGLRNFNAVDWLDYVEALSLATNTFGIMNMPVIRDERRGQVEFLTLAQKKTIEFEINYYQTRARQIARQLILSCIPTFTVAPLNAAPVNVVV